MSTLVWLCSAFLVFLLILEKFPDIMGCGCNTHIEISKEMIFDLHFLTIRFLIFKWLEMLFVNSIGQWRIFFLWIMIMI